MLLDPTSAAFVRASKSPPLPDLPADNMGSVYSNLRGKDSVVTFIDYDCSEHGDWMPAENDVQENRLRTKVCMICRTLQFIRSDHVEACLLCWHMTRIPTRHLLYLNPLCTCLCRSPETRFLRWHGGSRLTIRQEVYLKSNSQ